MIILLINVKTSLINNFCCDKSDYLPENKADIANSEQGKSGDQSID